MYIYKHKIYILLYVIYLYLLYIHIYTYIYTDILHIHNSEMSNLCLKLPPVYRNASPITAWGSFLWS